MRGQLFQAGHSLSGIEALSHGFQQVIQVMIGPVDSQSLAQVHQCSHHSCLQVSCLHGVRLSSSVPGFSLLIMAPF